MKKLRRSFPRVITLDPLEEYDGIVFFSFDSFADWIIENHEAESFSLSCRFTEEDDFRKLFSAVWHIGKHGKSICLVVEESSLFFAEEKRYPEMQKLVSQGRHYCINLIFVSQRVPELPISFRAQRNTVVSFLQIEPYDLSLLQRYGFNPDEIKSLDIGEYRIIGEALPNDNEQHGNES